MQDNYEPELKEVIEKNVLKNQKNPKNYFFNIGGHIGRWAIDLAYRHKYHGFVFEPSPETFRILQINTVLSRVQDYITLHHFALGDKEGSLQFEYFPSHDGGSRIKQTDIHQNNDVDTVEISVPVRVFDTMVANNEVSEEVIKNTRLIIMDVEGFEGSVLRGMQKTLQKFTNIDIIVEIFEHHPNKQDTIAFMESLGYTAK